jgi:hypothetical protein
VISSLADKAGRRGTTDRSSYLIDRFRVAYEFGGGWTCGCREFAMQDACKHTREADGRRSAQLGITRYLAQRPEETFSLNRPEYSAAPVVREGVARHYER